MAQQLVEGTDVWLNTPRRPLEACGTSGMKALANGSLNLSVLDGWWDEGYHPDFGWALGHGEVYRNQEAQDDIESRDLYNLLEKEVVPLFYHRGHDGIPRGWVEKMRGGLRHLCPIFNSHRMVQEYINRYYLTCSKRFDTLGQDDFSGAKELAAWRHKLMTSWHEVSIQSLPGIHGLEKAVGDELKVVAQVRLGSLSPDDVTVEAYYGPVDQKGDFKERRTVVLDSTGLVDGLYAYSGNIPCIDTGRLGYTVRITPSKEKLENRFVMGLITWA